MRIIYNIRPNVSPQPAPAIETRPADCNGLKLYYVLHARTRHCTRDGRRRRRDGFCPHSNVADSRCVIPPRGRPRDILFIISCKDFLSPTPRLGFCFPGFYLLYRTSCALPGESREKSRPVHNITMDTIWEHYGGAGGPGAVAASQSAAAAAATVIRRSLYSEGRIMRCARNAIRHRTTPPTPTPPFTV